MGILSPSAHLEKEGYVVIEDCLAPGLCGELLSHLTRLLSMATGLVESLLDDEYLFGNVKARSQRFDMKLSLRDALVRRALASLHENEVLNEVLNEFASPAATLCELSSLHSLPGSVAQPAHSDTAGTEQSIVTVFTALQDISEDMGPTMVYPRSHRGRASHSTAVDHARSVSRQQPPTAVTLRAGSVMVMDSRLVHLGSANTSEYRRVLLYSSWKLPTGTAASGTTASLLPEYGCRFKLGAVGTFSHPDYVAPMTWWDELTAAPQVEISGRAVGGVGAAPAAAVVAACPS